MQGLTAKNIDALAAQVGVAPENADEFGRRLGENWSDTATVSASAGTPVVRNTL